MVKCDYCEEEGTYWHVEINQENTRILHGFLCIKHYHKFLDIIMAIANWKKEVEKP